jgi:alkanesulfonate monooxygenase SsuD/methylene tetrahydromethanopterin reductase-like flavin-dependent oxidoreductase (luciferase family)
MIRTRLARLLRAAADRLEPPARVIERAALADGVAQGRADLQLVHGHRTWIGTERL